MIEFLATLALLCVQPGFVFKHDRRSSDGERYTEFCGGLRQRAETWVCVEISSDAFGGPRPPANPRRVTLKGSGSDPRLTH